MACTDVIFKLTCPDQRRDGDPERYRWSGKWAESAGSVVNEVREILRREDRARRTGKAIQRLLSGSEERAHTF